MKCPVCKCPCEERQICARCGFYVDIPLFVNSEEADMWVNTVVHPYRESYKRKYASSPIERLNLCNHAYYPIKAAGFHRVSDLIDRTFDELQRVCSMNMIAWRDLIARLSEQGFCIVGVPEDIAKEHASLAYSGYVAEHFNIEALAQVNSFAVKWLKIFENTTPEGSPFATPDVRGEFYDDLEDWGISVDIGMLRQNYRDTFQFEDDLAFLDDTDIFVNRVRLVDDIEMLSILICAKWRYRISRSEYTPCLKKWCVAAFDQLVKLSSRMLA